MFFNTKMSASGNPTGKNNNQHLLLYLIFYLGLVRSSLRATIGRYQMNCENFISLDSKIKKAISIHTCHMTKAKIHMYICDYIVWNLSNHPNTSWKMDSLFNQPIWLLLSTNTLPIPALCEHRLKLNTLSLSFITSRKNQALESRKMNVELKLSIHIMMQLGIFHFFSFQLNRPSLLPIYSVRYLRQYFTLDQRQAASQSESEIVNIFRSNKITLKKSWNHLR